MPRVLIVDDDEDVLRLLRLLLRTAGYDTATAINGAEALGQMRQQLPCVVLLDLKMPEMDGFEFRRQQLADPTIARVPVICLTAHYEPEQVGMQLGLGCLKKPLHFPDVVSAVESKCGFSTSSVDAKVMSDTPIDSQQSE
jgi:CheY-like chemotaxis protein